MSLKFDFGNTQAPKELIDYIKSQQENPAPFVRLPDGAVTLPKKRNKGSLVVVGIGGSNLGALAVYQALRPKKKVYFAETLDARRLDRIVKKIEHPATYLIISKSGTTAETAANAAVLLSKKKKGDQVVAITDEGSRLWQWAKKNSFDAIAIPKEIGGRYSVFTAAGLVPLALAGVNIGNLIKGAKEITPRCLSFDIAQNPAAQSALAIWSNWKAGKGIHDTFIFEPDLEGFGKWYRQLTGESVGKMGKGITPTVSIGTTDLHSVAQLYFDGPKDKFTTFISVADHGKDFVVKSKENVDELVPHLTGKSFSAILTAVLAAVKTTYAKQNLPSVGIELGDLSEETIGALLQMKMIEMMYLGKLMGVNPFDNPGVEAYKEETRKLLETLN